MMKNFKCQILDRSGFLSVADLEESLKIPEGHLIGFLFGRLRPSTGSVAALYNDFRLSDKDAVSCFVQFAQSMVDAHKDMPFTVENLRDWLRSRGYVGYSAAEVLRRAFSDREYIDYVNLPKEDILSHVKYWIYHGHNGYVNSSLDDLLNRAYAEGFKTLGDFLKAFRLLGLKDEKLTRDDHKDR